MNEATLAVRHGDLVAPVMSRVVGMLAARAQCPIDRLDDALLITDAVAAHAPGASVNGRVKVKLATDESGLSLTVLALRDGGATEMLEAAVLPGVGNVFEKVADDVRTAHDDDGAEALAIHLSFQGVSMVDGFAELTLEVRDRDVLEEFYSQVVGLEVLSRDDDRTWLAAGGHARLGLWLPGEKEFGDEGGRHVHYAFSASPDGLDALTQRLGERGVEHRGPVEHDGGDRSLYFEDPEGNVVEVWDFFARGQTTAALAAPDTSQ